MNYVCVNGKLYPANKPVIHADNRGYRYGDGLFETMKMVRNKIVLEKYHFERLFAGLDLLKIPRPRSLNVSSLRTQIRALARKNKCTDLARVRLSVSRGNGGLTERKLDIQWIIECTPLSVDTNNLNKKGLLVDIFPGAEKSCDRFCNLKSANFLVYVMASQHALDNDLDDSLVSNVKGHLADSTISNIFLVKNNLIITPSLSEGCINGVMRRWLIEQLKAGGFDMREGVVTKNDLEAFDEMFLSNAMGLRWVAQFNKKKYGKTRIRYIHDRFIAPLFE
jgi:branched-chain amino acid aminotransferase